MSDFLGREEVVLQLLIETRVAAPDPLEHHRGMFFFLVAVVREDRGEFLVPANVDALVVPVHGLQFFHQRNDRAVHVARLFAQFFYGLVVTLVSHLHLLRRHRQADIVCLPRMIPSPRYRARPLLCRTSESTYGATVNRSQPVPFY